MRREEEGRSSSGPRAPGDQHTLPFFPFSLPVLPFPFLSSVFPLLCLAAMLAFAPGCTPEEEGGSRISLRNFEAIHSDMKTQDLIDLLGEPTETFAASRRMDAYWRWVDGEKKIQVLIDQTGYVVAHGSRVVKYKENLE